MGRPKAAKGPPPWFRFFAKDFLTSRRVMAMTDAEKGQYITLLSHQWIEGSLPVDEQELALLATTRRSRATMATLRGVLDAFTIVDGVRLNLKLNELRESLEAEQKGAVERGRLGGEASARKRRCTNGAPRVSESVSVSVSGSGGSAEGGAPGRAFYGSEMTLDPAFAGLLEDWRALYRARTGRLPRPSAKDRDALARLISGDDPQSRAQVYRRMENLLAAKDIWFVQHRSLSELERSWDALAEVPKDTRRKSTEEALADIRERGTNGLMGMILGIDDDEEGDRA